MVGWDGAIRVPDANELGWKETVRVSPLEDTIVALRPISPKQPFGLPDSVRPLDPSMPIGSTMGFTNIDPLTGQPITPPITNQLFNFGWEYMWHCHILGHEEMDMMRPVVFNVARVLPIAPDPVAATVTTAVNLTWTDGTPPSDSATMGNPANEVGFRVERATVANTGTVGTYLVVGSSPANSTALSDTTAVVGVTYKYRVIAFNAAGDSPSAALTVGPPAPPAAPSNLAGVIAGPPQKVTLTWKDNSFNEDGFRVQRATNAAFTAGLSTFTVGADVATYVDTAANGLAAGTTYWYPRHRLQRQRQFDGVQCHQCGHSRGPDRADQLGSDTANRAAGLADLAR